MELKFYNDSEMNHIKHQKKIGLIVLISLSVAFVLFNTLMFVFANRQSRNAFLISTIVVDVVLALGIAFFACYMAYFISIKKHFLFVREGEEIRYEHCEVTDIILMLTSIKRNIKGVEVQIKIQKNKTKSLYFSEFYLDGVDIDIGKSYTFVAVDNFVKEFISYEED